jgi:hypothetical protein
MNNLVDSKHKRKKKAHYPKLLVSNPKVYLNLKKEHQLIKGQHDKVLMEK